MAPTSRKNYLNPACKTLKNCFTLADIQPGMFAPSIIKRMNVAQHGTRIVVKKTRHRFGGIVGVVVVDKDAYKIILSKRNLKIKQLKTKLKLLATSSDVNGYMKCLLNLGKVYGDNSLKRACETISLWERDWK